MSYAPWIAAGAAVVAAGAAAATPAPPHVWKTYANVRYGYSICYPSDLVVAQPEAPNSDGRKFTAKDGAVLTVYGANNVLDTPPADAAAATGARLAGAAGRVSYKVVKPGWSVVSGSGATTDFYAKSLYVADQTKSFELTYPPARAATWGPVAGRLNACFRSLKP